jgi:hypothetical protein
VLSDRTPILDDVLDWAELDPAKLERVAKILVHQACGATGIDGSGGDRAQDLRHHGPDGLTIYEVKSFTKRLTNSHRRQITRSLTSAVAEHAPARWVLVIPLDPSPAEVDWFDTLRDRYPAVKLEWWGRFWLDGQVAGREDLISYVEGATYSLLRRATQHQQERAALTTGVDYLQRMDDLYRLGATISPYWRWEIGNTPHGPARVLTPQRDDAAAEDPVQISTQFSFPPHDSEAAEAADALQRWLRGGGDVAIPGRFVQGLSVTADSEATQRLLGDPSQRQVASLHLMSIPDTTNLPLSGTLVLQPADGPVADPAGGSVDASGDVTGTTASPGEQRHNRPPTIPFSFTKRVGGPQGVTITGEDSSGALQGHFQMTDEDEITDELTLRLTPLAGRYPHEVLPAVALLAGCRSGSQLLFKQGPVTALTFYAGSDAPAYIDYLHHLIAALNVLQTHLQQLIPIPADPPTGKQAHELMAVASALSGTPGLLPYAGFTIQVRPGQIAEFLGSVPAEPCALYGASDPFTITLDDHDYTVPGLAWWSSGIELTNRNQLQAVVAEDHPDAAVVTAEFTCVSDHKVYVRRAVEDPGDSFTPIPSLSAPAGRDAS